MTTFQCGTHGHSNRLFLMVTFLLIGLISLPVAAGTNQILVNSTLDGVDEFSGTCTLREAIRNANLNQSSPIAGECAAGSDIETDVIILNSGEIYELTLPELVSNPDETGDLDLQQVGTPAIDLRIETDGESPATIRQTVAGNRVLENHGDHIELDNLLLSGGSIDGAGGGLLTTGGFLVLTQTEVNGNQAAAGGGIYSDGGLVRLVDSLVISNTATFIGGGGIFQTGVVAQMEIDGSHIVAGSAPAGGGLYVDGGAVVVENQSVFSQNNADSGNGAAIASLGSTDLIVRDSHFNGNMAFGDGGAIHHESTLPLSITDSLFQGNGGTSGGAVAITGPAAATIEQSKFESNNAVMDGGAIKADLLSISSSLLVDNEAFTGRGGAVFTILGATIQDRTEIRDNRATNGGGLYAQVLNLSDSRVENNTASELGGGLFISNRALVERSRIRGNSAATGAGIYLREFSNFESEFRRLLIADNSASDQGGGVWLGSDSVLANSTITLNAAAAGGGLYIAEAANARAINVTIVGHLTGQDIHQYGTLSLHNSIISTPGQGDCFFGPLNPSIDSQGYNIADDASCAGLDEPTDHTSTDPQLIPLGLTGGNTLTYAPAIGSPAIDGGDDAGCGDNQVDYVDQRGASRPIGANCDIGAHESGGVIPDPSVFADRFEE